MISILLVDDSKLFRSGLLVFLSRVADLEIVGQARDGREAIDLTEQLAPVIVLMDVQMPYLNGIDATKTLKARRNRARIILVTCVEISQLTVLDIGAMGYVDKGDIFDEAEPAIRAVLDGKTYFSKQVRARTSTWN